MADDFFDDDDLVPVADESKLPIGVSASAPRPAQTRGAAARMARQKDELTQQVVGAAKEIEDLKQRQEALEKAKHDIEELNRKQDEYERGKRDIIEKLDRALLSIRKERQDAERMTELLTVMGERFHVALGELRDINEEQWGDEGFSDELNRADALVENARALYKKAQAKIDAASWHRNPDGSREPAMVSNVASVLSDRPRFSYWLKVGFALALPMGIVLLTLFAVYLALVFLRLV